MVFGAMRLRSNTMNQSAIQFGCQSFHTDVKELVDSDLSLIYHHLKEGTQLSLTQFIRNGEPNIAVLFKGFRIGSLSGVSSKLVLGYIAKGKQMFCNIRAIERQKFLPPSSISIDISVR